MTIKRIKVHSREEICQNLEELLGDHSNAFISVVDLNADDVFAKDNQRALTLRFEDVSPDLFDSEERFQEICAQMEALGRPYQLFSASQAEQVVGFVRKLSQSPSEVVLHVHCKLGVSRSGAIGTWAAMASGLDLDEFAALNPQIQPNKLVLQTLGQAALTA